MPRSKETPSILPAPGARALAVLALLAPIATVPFALAVSGCGESAGGATPDLAAAGAAADRRAVPVAVASAKVGRIASTYRATATLEVENEADVVARVEGIVKAIAVEEGDLVAAGGPLLEIEDAEYRLRVDLAQAKRSNLESRYERIRQLSQDLISAVEIEAARSELETARAEEGLARLNLSYTGVTAPFGGRIVERYVDPGQKVKLDQPLFRVADFSTLLARVHVPAKEFKKLKVDQDVELELDSNGEKLTGRIKLVSPVIDPTTGTIKVTVEVRGDFEGTRPGDFAEVEIVTDVHPSSILVPRPAVITDKEEQVVFVVEDGTAERRVVEVGFTDDDHAEITSGIAPSEIVVVKGQRSLKHSSPVKVLSDAPPPAPAELSGSPPVAGKGGNPGASSGP
jgi:membrane fusion protein (multidrug efflux system)